MNFHQHEQRQAATRQFLESLNTLGHCAHTTDGTDAEASAPSPPPPASPSAVPANSDLAAWEEAALDIEQFMQSR